VLIFDNNTEEQFAVTIPLIQRVDKINVNNIQHIGDKEYLEYHNSQMRLLRLHDYLPVRKPTEQAEIVSVIIPKQTQTPVALMINQIIDTQIIEADLSGGSMKSKGIIGSTLVNGRITLLLDLYAILEAGDPDALHRISFNPNEVGNLKILLVEDTPLFQVMIKEYLKSVGFDVTLAVNGQLGFEYLSKSHYDMVISDIEMPVMDGFGLIKKIRANSKWKDLPVIAVTSLDDEKTIQAGLDAGFNDWMIKLDKPRIMAAIQKFLPISSS